MAAPSWPSTITGSPPVVDQWNRLQPRPQVREAPSGAGSRTCSRAISARAVSETTSGWPPWRCIQAKSSRSPTEAVISPAGPVARARYLAGLKGYVTNIDLDALDGPAVVTAYHELYQVEPSFRMTKSDLAARPIFHRIRDSIEAHLTIVFAALAISREAQARTGVSIKKIMQTLRPLRSATISLGNQQLTAPPRIPDHAQAILDDLAQGGH